MESAVLTQLSYLASVGEAASSLKRLAVPGLQGIARGPPPSQRIRRERVEVGTGGRIVIMMQSE